MKKIIKSVISAVVLAVISFSAFAEVKENEKCISFTEGSPFAINWIADSAIFGVSAVGAASAVYLKKTVELPAWDGNKYDLSTVNPVDAFVAHPFNKTLHLVGTATCGADLAILPACVFGAEALFGNLPLADLGKVTLMYAESFFVSYAIKDLLKVSVSRVRPYMYFDNPPVKAGSNDWQYSFPSGHTTNAFLGASFLSYVFAQYYPESSFKVPVIVTSYALAAGTGVLRMLSGNHFLTDVATGAVIGTVCGIGIPVLHQYVFKKFESESSKVSAAVSPFGVNVRVNL